MVINARLAVFGDGHSEDAQLSADQSAAVQGTFDALVGEELTLGGNSPEVHFFDLTAANPSIAVYPAYQLNLIGGTEC